MKVKVKTAFKDKNTNELYKVGEELEMSVQRVNEVLKVGNFIELVEQDTGQHGDTEKASDHETEKTDPCQDVDAQKTEAPKQTGRRKRTNK